MYQGAPRKKEVIERAKDGLRGAIVAAGYVLAGTPGAVAQQPLVEVAGDAEAGVLSTDQQVVLTALELPNALKAKGNVSVNKGHPYCADMKRLGVPQEIEWQSLYALAGTVSSGYFGELAAEKAKHYTGQEESVVPFLRAFSEKHQSRNPLELAQAAYLVYRDIAARKVEPTPAEVRATADRIKVLREKYANIDYLGPGREVIVAAGNDVWPAEHKREGYQFVSPDFETALLKRQNRKASSFHRGPEKEEDAREARRKLLYDIAAASEPLTFVFEGHGFFNSDADNYIKMSQHLRIKGSDIVEAFVSRYNNPAVRKRAESQPDIIILSMCFGFDMGDYINRSLQEKGLPGIIAVTSAERTTLSLSMSTRPFFGRFNEIVATSVTFGVLQTRMSDPAVETKPTIAVPETLPSRGLGKRFMQISGAPPAEGGSVA